MVKEKRLWYYCWVCLVTFCQNRLCKASDPSTLKVALVGWLVGPTGVAAVWLLVTSSMFPINLLGAKYWVLCEAHLAWVDTHRVPLLCVNFSIPCDKAEAAAGDYSILRWASTPQR